MPKKTIAGLEAQIKELRELREHDGAMFARYQRDIEKIKEDYARLKEAYTALDNDKRWLKTLAQNLAVPMQERNSR